MKKIFTVLAVIGIMLMTVTGASANGSLSPLENSGVSFVNSVALTSIITDISIPDIQLSTPSYQTDVSIQSIQTDVQSSSGLTQTSFGATVSTWAKDEIENAYLNGLIPVKMLTDDLSKKVTREEFAAIAVELYKQLSDISVSEAADCRFEDISDSKYATEIRQAYYIEAVQGISETAYEPELDITREQLATMLCRVVKRNMEERGVAFVYPTDYTKFADDMYISDWARDSVYFMATEGLINGVDAEKNLFAPQNVTEEQEALGYASATKEQAIIIAQRIFSK